MSESIKIFKNLEALKKLYKRPLDIKDEPLSNFPIGYYEKFLQQIKEMGIDIITYKDIFKVSKDRDHKSFYDREYRDWKRKYCDPTKIYLLIQHDIDNLPNFTKRMVAMEAVYGIKSNIFMFRDRYIPNGVDETYKVDHEYFQEAEKNGYVIGYHQNAFALSGFSMEEASKRFISDVNHLRNFYNIEFVVPHGGAGGVVNGNKIHNFDVEIPEEFKNNLRWVFNRYGIRFSRKWSDGGLGKTRDMERIKTFDIVNKFLPELEKGNRYFCLIHPQRWGYNLNTSINPMLAEEKWYKDICSTYL